MAKKRRFRIQILSYWTYFWMLCGGAAVAVLLISEFLRPNHITRPLFDPHAIHTRAVEPRIISLVPQATEILLSMGCGDHLAAVSNFDNDPQAKSLPRVGDYQTTDWETIAALHPKWIITHFGRIPPGFSEHATALGIRELNLLTETIDSNDKMLTIEQAIADLGNACLDADKVTMAIYEFRTALNQLGARSAKEQKVNALVVVGDGAAITAAGADTFLSQALDYAGGFNAADKLAGRYPHIDREQLAALHPDVIIQLLPSASPQVLRQARNFWAAMPQLAAVRNGRVVQLTDWYVLLPGCHTTSLVESFFKALHPPQSETAPATQSAG